jgi:PBP1b-binding outer membrane lipoprotein LpoB
MKKEHDMKNLKIWLAIVIIFVLLTGCSPQETALTGDEQDAVLAYSEAKTDNLLAGMNANDYAAFSKDFDQQMLNAMTQAQFDALKKDRDEKLGQYVSRQVNKVIQTGDFNVVFYDAKFEKEDPVTVRVVFRIAEPHQISGLWFSK